MEKFEAPVWEVVLFSDDVIRTSKTLPIDWFHTNGVPDPDPKQPT